MFGVMENLSEGLIVGDEQGRTIYWNPAALALNGFANMDECSRRLDEFAHIFEMSVLDEDTPLLVAEGPMSRAVRASSVTSFTKLRSSFTLWKGRVWR